MFHLETDRLRFRQWQNEDHSIVADFFSSEENVKYVGGVLSPEASWRMLATYIGHYELNGFSYAALTEKKSNQLIGTVGLWNSPSWPEPELGYWLLSASQGKGYAVEAASVVKQFALEELQLASLVSYIASANTPSIRLAEKLGATKDGAIELLNFGPHDVYRHW